MNDQSGIGKKEMIRIRMVLPLLCFLSLFIIVLLIIIRSATRFVILKILYLYFY